MKNPIPARFVLSLPLLLMCSMAYAQETDSLSTEEQGETGQAAVEEVPAQASQEVEVNEDVYRQFMELKDARRQRIILPEDAFKPGSGSQKLDELPEESQKHLRNQLREIIVKGDPWQPGDENRVYPYEPSAATIDNPQLQKQESEAWGELLESYHKREAQIYQNSARTAAAMAAGSPMNGNGSDQANQQGSTGQGGGQASSGESSQAQKEPGNKTQKANDLANTTNITSTTGTAGVSQNAMEFLKRMSAANGNGDGANQAENGTNEDTGNGSEPGGPLEEANQVTQQSLSDENTNMDPAAAETGSVGESLAGASQNALEFLKQDGDNPKENTGSSPGESDMPGDADEQTAQSSENSESTETDVIDSMSNQSGTQANIGISQNALEYLNGEQPPVPAGQEANTINPAELSGTLSIQDLVNARGLGADRRSSPPGNTDGGQGPGVKPPEKDNDDDG